MKTIINAANIEKINSFIKLVEGKSTARTVSAEELVKIADKITRNLDIPKKAMVGITAHVDPWAQNFPNAYKHTPFSTQFLLEYTKSGWSLLQVSRDKTHRANDAVLLSLTDDAKDAIIKAASRMNNYQI